MKNQFLFSTLCILLFIFITASKAYSQVMTGTWSCVYATAGSSFPNAIENRTISVGVIKPNTFVALVRRGGAFYTNYLVGYSNADSVRGRMGVFTNAMSGYRQAWISGFDFAEMREAHSIAATPDSLIYVANNDIERNILVFKMSSDSVISSDYRLVTGADSIWAIDVDGNRRVYVSARGAINQPWSIRVFKSIAEEPAWLNSRISTPLTVITMPEPGEIRGVTVNRAGTVVYASNFTTKKIYCFVGSVSTGFTLANGFNFLLTDTRITAAGDTLRPSPWGLNFMDDKNILFVACDVSFRTGSAYEYGRIYAINPNTGAVLSTIDCAQWNFDNTGAWQNRPSNMGTVSGYASTYNVDFDKDYRLYTQSYYGWTVDKWNYSGTLPIIPLTIVGIEKNGSLIPTEFKLEQNFPNPFNPATTIEFSINERSIVSLKIYSVTGQEVATVVTPNELEKGNYKYTFDASKLSSGTYIYSLTAGGKTIAKKMTLIK